MSTTCTLVSWVPRLSLPRPSSRQSAMDSDQLCNVLVTGGSRRIGAAAVRALHRDGASIAFSDTSNTAAARHVCASRTNRVHALQANLAVAGAAERLWDDAIAPSATPPLASNVNYIPGQIVPLTPSSPRSATTDRSASTVNRRRHGHRRPRIRSRRWLPNTASAGSSAGNSHRSR